MSVRVRVRVCVRVRVRVSVCVRVHELAGHLQVALHPLGPRRAFHLVQQAGRGYVAVSAVVIHDAAARASPRRCV